MSAEQVSQDNHEEIYQIRSQVEKMSRGLSVLIKEQRRIEEEVNEIKEALQ